ncbi:hypothetical protein KOAAANKH_02547 [Brevundimonas sp. NIBR10]|uniref:hypothetical protein n=1 Tax=Brevundimonas sp. NIBR10 TaxID=3015997 RepID=UPI0022F1DCDD|nr:hypothetical protein [Brevundimonas sp. NIBR10]WGM47665.1 hypothetical protein KOAAANKH_02547 [Brevundimonas sp. NIBR10]
MARYLIKTVVSVTMEEEWSVEAESEDAAREALDTGAADFLFERSLEDEYDREVTSITPFTA